MSGDEIFAFLVSLLAGAFGWSRWVPAWWRPARHLRATVRGVAWLCPALCAAALLGVLTRWAAHDVRDSVLYTGFYSAMGFGWTGLLVLGLPFFGLDWREDVVERGNPAAALAVSGALYGGLLAFAGGNVGDGPGWWVVLFSGGLATGSLLLLWVAANAQSRIEEAATLDRDTASGWRVLGWWVGAGLILGRAAAGNWESAVQTAVDFARVGWPALLLCEVAVVVHLFARPSPRHPRPDAVLLGVGPALLYVLLGLGVVWLAGPP